MNYYEILGVSADATDQQIKEAYRREAMKWHPDRHEGAAAKAHADKKFKELAVAYRTLRDPAGRDAYDREIDQKLRDDYNARQRAQAKQQKEWAQQEQRTHEFADTDPSAQEESMSGDDANQMFFDQMLDLAFELAGRAFPESKIVQALVALGCPESMAKAVAAIATKKAANARSKSDESAIPSIAAPVSQAAWEKAEPYYLALITRKSKDKPLQEDIYKELEKKIKFRNKIALASIAILFAILLFIKIEWPHKILATLIYASVTALALIIINNFTIPNQYHIDSRTRIILNAFRSIHFGHSTNKFNFYAFFFNVGWLSYRKMYLFSFLATIGYIATALICYFYFKLNIETIGGIQIGISALLGLFSYQIYHSFATTKINKHLTNHGVSAHQLVAKKYGYSIVSAIIGVVLTAIIYTPVNEIISSDMQKRAHQERLAEEEKSKALQVAAAEKQRAIEEQQNAANARELAKSKAAYKLTLANIEARHPELNSDSPRYNSNAEAWVVERINAHKGQGLTALQALQKAVQEYEFEIEKAARRSKTNDSNFITEYSSSGNYIGTGENISLHFKSIEIRSLLQVMSDFTNIKIEADDEISGSVAIRVQKIPWDEALSKVMHARGLKATKTGPTTLYIHPQYMSEDLVFSRATKKGFTQ